MMKQKVKITIIPGSGFYVSYQLTKQTDFNRWAYDDCHTLHIGVFLVLITLVLIEFYNNML